MRRGVFITLEGGEGAGKSTQAALLAEALRARGIAVVQTREPGGTPGAEAIRGLLLEPGEGGWGARAETLLFAAARADHVEKVIRPALASGAWVICDRFVDSSRAYQSAGFGASRTGISDDDILAINTFSCNGLVPDLTLVFAVSPQVATARLVARDAGKADRIGGRDAAYHARVAMAFAYIAEAEPDRVQRIDADAAQDEVHRAVMGAVAPRLAER